MHSHMRPETRNICSLCVGLRGDTRSAAPSSAPPLTARAAAPPLTAPRTAQCRCCPPAPPAGSGDGSSSSCCKGNRSWSHTLLVCWLVFKLQALGAQMISAAKDHTLRGSTPRPMRSSRLCAGQYFRPCQRKALTEYSPPHIHTHVHTLGSSPRSMRSISIVRARMARTMSTMYWLR